MPRCRGLAYRSKCGTGRETHKPARHFIGLQSLVPNLCSVNDHNVKGKVMHLSSDGDRSQECPPSLHASKASVDICFEGEQLQGGKTWSNSNHCSGVEECKLYMMIMLMCF